MARRSCVFQTPFSVQTGGMTLCYSSLFYTLLSDAVQFKLRVFRFLDEHIDIFLVIKSHGEPFSPV